LVETGNGIENSGGLTRPQVPGWVYTLDPYNRIPAAEPKSRLRYDIPETV